MKNMNLRIKMYILVLITLIPLILMQFITVVSQHKQAVDMELKASQDFAEAINVAFLNYVDKIWYSEAAIGFYIIQNPSFDSKKVQQYLKKCASEEKTVRNYLWINPNGTITASSDIRDIGVNISHRHYINRIMSGEEKVVSDLLEGKATNSPTLTISKAIRENGELKGIVCAGIDIDKLDMVLPINRAGITSSFGLIDRQGMIVYRNAIGNMSLEERRIEDDSPAWTALRGSSAIVEECSAGIDDSPRIGVNMPVAQIGWVSFTTISKEEILKKPNQAALFNIAITVFAILFSFMAATYLIRQILIPIITIQKAARAVSSRDFSVRTNISGKDELSETGLAFDQMIEHIQELESGRQLFLQTAAHELRNPMTGIKGITSLIYQRVMSGKQINNSLPLIETLEKEVSRLSVLLNQILEAFQVQRENVQIKANFKLMNISEVVNRAANFYQLNETIGRNITNKSVGAIYVFGDPERLEDVVRNLISNAVKYSKEMTNINLNTYVEGSNVMVSVRDEGIGIPDGHLEKIFNSFYRAYNLPGKDPGGMGLGLYICKDIIERHGGSIWAENNRDGGSTFYIKLPLYKG